MSFRQKKFKPNSSLLWHLVLILFVVISSGISAVLLGKDFNFDLLSYHFYHPFAYLTHRGHSDYWPPSFIQVYVNPAIDFLTYFLIQYFRPTTAVAIMGMLHSLNLFLLYQIIRKVTWDDHLKNKRMTAIGLTLICVLAPLFITYFGTFNGDNIVCIFIFSSLLSIINFYLQLKRERVFNKSLLVISGLSYGFILGLKLTSLLYLFGFMFGIIFIDKNYTQNLKIVFIWLCCAGAAMLVSGGYWMLPLWIKYHNPFFPYFNGIFHSPYFPSSNIHMVKFLPDNMLKRIFLPLYISGNGVKISDTMFSDFRFVALFFTAISYFIYFIKNKISQHRIVPDNFIYKFLFIFFFFSYVTWVMNATALRYVINLELLTPVIIYMICQNLKNNKTLLVLPFFCFSVFVWFFYLKYNFFLIAFFLWLPWVFFFYFKNSHYLILFLFLLLFYSLMLTMKIGFSRIDFSSKDYFGVQIPNREKLPLSALVLVSPTLGGGLNITVPSSLFAINAYLIPFLPKGWNYMGVEVEPSTTHYVNSNTLSHAIKNSSQPLFLLALAIHMPQFIEFANNLGLKKSGDCINIYSERVRIEKKMVENSFYHIFFPKNIGEIELCPFKMENNHETT